MNLKLENMETLTNEMKEQLKNGETLEFTNENEELMSLTFGKSWGGMFWNIELNAKVIKMSKTFKAFETKVNSLIKERELELI